MKVCITLNLIIAASCHQIYMYWPFVCVCVCVCVRVYMYMNGFYPLTVHTYVYYTQYGSTALMWAALNGHSETVHVLVQLGADLNVQDKVCM